MKFLRFQGRFSPCPPTSPVSKCCPAIFTGAAAPAVPAAAALDEELCPRLCAGSASPSHRQEPTQPRHDSLQATTPHFLQSSPRSHCQGMGFVMHLLQAAKRMFPEERENLRCSAHCLNSSSQTQRWQMFCAQSSSSVQPDLLIKFPVTEKPSSFSSALLCLPSPAVPPFKQKHSKTRLKFQKSKHFQPLNNNTGLQMITSC